MARIYEYQGKEILKKIGIRVPKGRQTSDPSEARRIEAEGYSPIFRTSSKANFR